MASHFYFRLGADDGLRSLFLQYVPHLLEWCWADYMDFDRPTLDLQINKLEELVKCGESALQVSTPDEAALIDRLSEHFMGLDDVCGGSMEPWGSIGPPLGRQVGYLNINNYDWYAGVHIKRFASDELFTLWNYITEGRSLADGIPGYKFSRVSTYRVGYWAFSELEVLAGGLEDLSKNQKFLNSVNQEDHDISWRINDLIEIVIKAARQALEAKVGIVMNGH